MDELRSKVTHCKGMDSADDDEEGDCYSELHSRWVRTNTEEREQLKDEGIEI